MLIVFCRAEIARPSAAVRLEQCEERISSDGAVPAEGFFEDNSCLLLKFLRRRNRICVR
jgi:hypothetical protein